MKSQDGLFEVFFVTNKKQQGALYAQPPPTPMIQRFKNKNV